ncbi:unnamed protein product, partial [Heterotrigona itama]
APTIKYAIYFLLLEIIDISYDRFLSERNGGKKHTLSVKKKISSNNSQ